MVGNHNLDRLEEIAVENFNDVVDKNLIQTDYKDEITFNQENGLGHIFKIIPLKDVKSLSIVWPIMPEFQSKWMHKPQYYITHVIGHEGPNSLLSELIKQGLALSLSCGTETRL